MKIDGLTNITTIKSMITGTIHIHKNRCFNLSSTSYHQIPLLIEVVSTIKQNSNNQVFQTDISASGCRHGATVF